MNEPLWLRKDAIVTSHHSSIAQFGGSQGIRDEGLLESALARPENKFAYETTPSLAELAAAYSFGLARNHPFVDGNKRIAFAAAAMFLAINGYRQSIVRQGPARHQHPWLCKNSTVNNSLNKCERAVI